MVKRALSSDSGALARSANAILTHRAEMCRPTTEVFLGGLPRAASKLAAVESGLHTALLDFCATSDRSAVKLRLHSQPSGQGLGFGFAWLPDEHAAQRLVAATEIFFELDGKRVRAGTRAARGAPTERAAPTTEPGQLRLSVAVFASLDCSWLAAGFDAWRRCLRDFGVGLELQLLPREAGFGQFERTHCDLFLLLWRRGDLSPQETQRWAQHAQSVGLAGRAVLVVEVERHGAAVTSSDDAPAPSDEDDLSSAPIARIRASCFSLRAAIAAKSADCGSEPSPAPAPDPELALAAVAAAAVAAGGGGRVDVFSGAALRALYPWRGPPCGAAHAAAVSTLAVRRAVACPLCALLKVYVCDCDGTLWEGAVSEEGAAGVTFGAHHLALQRAVAALQAAGRLVCLASKNDEADVLECLRSRAAEMALGMPQLTAWEVHWQPK
eukprot:CAMPEP_0185469950 /NCGR_PEP_ID=MMETSP1365-20130426/98486_1 /TAXON_ID=38817 /ORGANISM="Gephyrocapsa oceanica, Strain RCC1303" /LENGTH=438 /DNA_ID=CAMNT_0028076689 /DNA_START=56 /DNA_END=1371 /DNA_ORIENTATION=+